MTSTSSDSHVAAYTPIDGVISGHGDTSVSLAARLEQPGVRMVAAPTCETLTAMLAARATAPDVLIAVTDATTGLGDEACRVAHLGRVLGVHHVVLAVGGADDTGQSHAGWQRLDGEWRSWAARAKIERPICVPISLSHDAMITSRGAGLSWYVGPTLLECLAEARRGVDTAPDVPTSAPPPTSTADQFEATVIWLHEQPLLPGRAYRLVAGGRSLSGTLTPLKYRVDARTLAGVAATTLARGDVGVGDLELSTPIAFEPFTVNRLHGRIDLVDPLSDTTVGITLLHFALRRSQNVRWQALDVDKARRAALKGQRACVLWFTGLSGAGKSTIANLVEQRLAAAGRHTYLLDGDNVRHGLNKDLGFTDADRVENIRRVAEVARLMADAGLIVLVSFISPFRAERRMARSLLPDGEFLEVFVDTPLAVAEARDPKGLYRKVRRGELRNFTGVDSPYEVPERPEIRIETTRLSPEEAADVVLRTLEVHGVLDTGQSHRR